MLASAFALAASAASALDGETEPTNRHGHTHSAEESDEADRALMIQLAYTGEVMGNASGGVRRGARYLDNLDVVVDADLDRLAGWKGTRAHVYGLYNNGKSIGGLVGDAQAISNIETGTAALRLYEAWIDQMIGERISVRAGLYDLNSEFDALDAAALFVSSPHGIGTDFAQSGRNGPSIFPSTSLAARVQFRPSDGWAVRAAVLDGVPGNPDRPGRTAIRLGHGDGALLVGEVEAPLEGGKLLLGTWKYTARFDRNDDARPAKGNTGAYIRGEFLVIERGEHTVDAFFRLGAAAGRFNMFDRFAGGGLKFSGWVPGRKADEFGIAMAAAFTSHSHRAATGAGASEVAIEATYRAPITDWFTLQPSVHYVRNPSADCCVADALVLGLRAEFSFEL